MTLTDLLPTLRRSLPDPLDPTRWPACTHASVADVVVAGVSMTRLVDLCGTPCVHTADTVSVVCVAVVAVSDPAESPRDIVVDACLDAVAASWHEARLIGRVSTRLRHPTRVRSRGVGAAVLANLPDDVAPGDLLAVPCACCASLRDLADVAP